MVDKNRLREQQAIVLMGGNESGTLMLFDLAVLAIEKSLGKVVLCSMDYESTPWGFESDSLFYNRVLQISTTVMPQKFLQGLLSIETKLGRERINQSGYSSRGIDLDLLFYGNEVIRLPKLAVPHPRLHLRRFTLVPLCEKWANMVHPVFGKTMKELLSGCPDDGFVKPVL